MEKGGLVLHLEITKELYSLIIMETSLNNFISLPIINTNKTKLIRLVNKILSLDNWCNLYKINHINNKLSQSHYNLIIILTKMFLNEQTQKNIKITKREKVQLPLNVIVNLFGWQLKDKE